MKFLIHYVSERFRSVTMKKDGATYDFGLLNEDERRELAFELNSAADELLDGLNTSQEAGL